MEKNRNSSPAEIFSKLKNKKILIPLHFGPDGDSIGVSQAMSTILREQFNCDTIVFSQDPVSCNLKKDEILEGIFFNKTFSNFKEEEYDIILFMDSGLGNFIKKESFKIPENKTIINIDHHHTNNYFGNLNYVNSEKPSACSVLLDMLEKEGIKINKTVANFLLVGVYTDSSGFVNNSTKALEDVSRLKKKGAEIHKIINMLSKTPLKLKRYFAEMIHNIKIEKIDKYQVGYASITSEKIHDLKLNLSDVRTAPVYFSDIDEIEIKFTLAELEKGIKGSLRSNNDIDISGIAEKLGGGGHKNAASFILDRKEFDDMIKAEKHVLSKIREHLSE